MRFIRSYTAKNPGVIQSCLTMLLLLIVLTTNPSREALSDDAMVAGAPVTADNTARVAEPKGSSSRSELAQETTAIDGHVLIVPSDVATQSGPAKERFKTLQKERLWAVTKLEQLRSQLDTLAGEPHQPPTPVPIISEAEYDTRVKEIDAKIRTFERDQNNRELSESERQNARVQLLDLTRQKARAALEMTTSRKWQQQKAAYEDVKKREQIARAATQEASYYLSKIDDAVSNLMITSASEGFFRLGMGGGFLLLVLVLIVCFFVFGSRSGSMQDIFTNDRGLQFITLFSLVIAITMFGLMNILEGRELAALLGGLSGYILGKSNLGGPQRDAAQQNGTHVQRGT